MKTTVLKTGKAREMEVCFRSSHAEYEIPNTNIKYRYGKSKHKPAQSRTNRKPTSFTTATSGVVFFGVL